MATQTDNDKNLAGQKLTDKTAKPEGCRQNVLLSFVIIGLLVVLFHFQGNTTYLAVETRSVFIWIAAQWLSAGGDFAHGWIMPFISIYVLWIKRREIIEAEKKVSWIGLTVIVLSLFIHWAASRAQQTRVSLVAFVGLLWGIPYYLSGWKVAKRLLFPCGYLLLCFVSYFLINLAFPLRIAASAIATQLLRGLGIDAVRRGTMIFSAAAGGFHFNVADACSGLRSLFVMTALAAPYAFFTQKSLFKKWLLFILSVPLAAVANVVRIVIVALVAEGFGQKLAMKVHDDYAGFLVFAIAVILMMSAGSIVEQNWKGRMRKWLNALRTSS
jgi:exosortase